MTRSPWAWATPPRAGAGAAGRSTWPPGWTPRSCITWPSAGAQAKQVERDQLPAALALRPDIASVVVGINDTLRAGFDPVRTGQATARTVAALAASGATVLTMRLPDPAQMFGLPTALARPLTRRMRAVNAELDKIAAHFGTLHWDASSDPQTYDRRNWSVDRLHPNERGHRLIACRFWDRLDAAGHQMAAGPTLAGPGATRRDDLVWMATKGTSWCLRRSIDLIPYLLFMAAREALIEPREEGPELPAAPSGLANAVDGPAAGRPALVRNRRPNPWPSSRIPAVYIGRATHATRAAGGHGDEQGGGLGGATVRSR